MPSPSARNSQMLALVRCRGGRFTPLKRLARDFPSCAAAHDAAREQICPVGCLGIGDCLGHCEQGAITITPTGVAVVDHECCSGCGQCLAACPREIIDLLSVRQRTNISCRSTLPTAEREALCPRGCTGCGRCLSVCPCHAVSIHESLAVIDQHRCDGCGLCAEWCPQHCISFLSLGGFFAPTNPLGTRPVCPR